MRQFIADHLPWLMSALTITCIELQGRKWPRAWALSLAGQVFWFTWIWASQSWGFLPMAGVLSFQYVRNHLRWMGKRKGFQPIPRLNSPCSACPSLTRCMSAGFCVKREGGKKPPNRAQEAPSAEDWANAPANHCDCAGCRAVPPFRWPAG